MKHFLAVLALPLFSACVSIDLPGVVSDSAKLAKEAYKAVAGKKEEETASSETELSDSVLNTYIGQERQSPAEVKSLCITEAAAKLFKANGKEVPYTISQNAISTVNNSIAATCRVRASKVVQAPSPERK